MSDLKKIVIRLKDGPFGSETPWAEVDGDVATLSNNCWFAPLGIGDKVKVQPNGDGDLQVVDLLERDPETHLFRALTISEEEIDNEIDVDEMDARGRWVTFWHQLEEAGVSACAEGGYTGASGVMSFSVKGAMTADEVENLYETVSSLAETNRIYVHLWAAPDDDLTDEEIRDHFDFTLFEGLPKFHTTYRAQNDDHWPPSPEFRNWVQDMAERDPRVAADLERGRYDRVELLISRFLTDPQDLVPLDGPIWKEDE